MQAQQELSSISFALSVELPATNRDRTLRMGFLWDRTLGGARNSLWLLMAAAGTFLLIGCANVANLLLARGMVRRREVAVRMAMGAGRARIVCQFLTESFVLAAFGGIGGYVLTAMAWEILPKLAPVSIPRLAAARADSSVFVFAVLTALANGILFGIVPALRAISSKGGISTCDLAVRSSDSRKTDWIRGALVVGEVAVSVVLIIVGGQLVGSFVHLVRTDPGFEVDRVVASVVLPARERYRTPSERAVLYRRFLDAVRTLPGVQSAGTVDALPFSGENHGGFISLREAPLPNDQVIAEIDVVSTQYLQTMGTRLIEGRWFREEEMNESSEVAIVNDMAASRLWPGTSAIGKSVCVYCTPETPRNWKQVIGVVSSMRHASLDEPLQASVYLSGGAFENATFLVVRTDRPTGEVDKAIRNAIATIDPDQPVLLSAPMQALLAESVADRRFVMSLVAATGFLALLMAAAGVYGVTLYTTSLRTQEFGIRTALGATPRKIHGLVFRQAFSTVALGLVVGLTFALSLVHALRGMLVGVEGGNPEHIWMAAALVSLTTAVACWIPAWRATRVDPVSALRRD